MATFDGNGHRADVQTYVSKEPEGTYSSIRLSDGTVETILFQNDGTTVGPVHTYQGLSEIHRAHIRRIQTEIVKGA